MKHTKPALSFLLALCMTASLAAVSCSDSTTKPEAVTTGASATEAVTDTETESPYQLSLPDGLDFGGEEIFIYGWEHYEDIEFYAESENGEIVNDAVFRRNSDVEENLNITLAFSEVDGRGGGEWNKKVSNANKAGDAAYDIVAGHSHRIGELTQSGDLLNLLEYQYLDLEQPWWRSELTERAVICDKLFFVTGDICPSSVSRSQGIFFNTDLINSYDLEDPYQLVIDGTWTHAKLMDMSKGLYIDLNSDSKKDEEGDQFGFAIDDVQLQAVGITSGIVSIEQDDSGYLCIPEDYVNDHTATLLDKWIAFMHNNEDTVRIATVDDTSVFRNGRALFYAFPLGIISSELRDCEFNIGFVPWPKADENQEDYITCTSNAYSLWSVPISAADPDMSCAVMENLAYEGFLQIMPAMFETAYKVKYNNTESQLQSQVFDILRENLTFDIGRIMSTVTGGVFYLFSDGIISGKNNLASKFETVQKKADKLLSKWMDELESGE